jgi:hypothetical protein
VKIQYVDFKPGLRDQEREKEKENQEQATCQPRGASQMCARRLFVHE